MELNQNNVLKEVDQSQEISSQLDGAKCKKGDFGCKLLLKVKDYLKVSKLSTFKMTFDWEHKDLAEFSSFYCEQFK